MRNQPVGVYYHSEEYISSTASDNRRYVGSIAAVFILLNKRKTSHQ